MHYVHSINVNFLNEMKIGFRIAERQGLSPQVAAHNIPRKINEYSLTCFCLRTTLENGVL